jgi:hypothetical protein
MTIFTRGMGLALGLALCLAIAAAAADQEAIDRSIAGGVTYLKQSQQESGEWQHNQNRTGATALALLTLLECDVEKDDPIIRKAAQFLRQTSISLDHTYSISLVIMALDRLGGEKDKALMESLTRRLLKGQNLSGGWSYICPVDAEDVRRLQAQLVADRQADDKADAGKPASNLPPQARQFDKRLGNPAGGIPAPPNQPFAAVPPGPAFGGPQGDNSNTQFATLALWVARRQKFDLAVDKALAGVERRFRNCQNADGGWTYVPVPGPGTPSTASMTCAGLLGLGIGFGVHHETVMRTDLRVGKKKPKPDALRDPNRDPIIRAGLLALGRLIKGPFKTAQSVNWPLVGPGNLGLANNKFVGQNARAANLPGGGRPDYYALWSIERVAMAYGLKTFDKQDWYSWGADIILANQRPAGNWSDGGYTGGGTLTDTCFALLFLRRSNLASDLTDKLKGRVDDPGERKLTSGGIGGDSLKHRDEPSETGPKEAPPKKNEPKKGTLPELAPAEEKISKTGPSSRPARRNDETRVDLEVARLSKELIEATPERQGVVLDKLREGKGLVYTQALAEAIPQLAAGLRAKSRDALAQRLARMTAATLRDKFDDDNLEIRRAAALASAVKAEKSFVPDLIKLLDDAEPPVAHAAHASLKALTEQDFGPGDDASRAERKKAISAWKNWWNQKGSGS